MAPNRTRKKRTRKECATLEAAGLIDLNYVEQINGELIKKVPKPASCGA
jgi:hypothetical protein